MSPRPGDRRKITGRQIGAAAAGAALIAISIGVITTIGQWSDIPTPSLTVMRLDLLSTRDADQSTPCGLPAGGLSDSLPLVADQTWTRTGGDVCYPTSATTAQCFADTETPYTVDGTGLAWVVEPDAINRIVYSTAIDCTNWTCRGTASATPLQAAPDGSATATLLTVGGYGNDVFKTATGYTISTAISARVWVKCSAGTLHMLDNATGVGHWSINCAVIAGAWAYLTPAHPAVTIVGGWISGGGGATSPLFYAGAGTVTAYIWAPTLTEEPGSGLMVIPTAAAAVSSGDISWTVDNSSGRYYKVGDTVTQTLTAISGTCWVVSGTDLLLTGAAGSECTGLWRALTVTR